MLIFSQFLGLITNIKEVFDSIKTTVQNFTKTQNLKKLIKNLDRFLYGKYGEKPYYDSLYRYIHCGEIRYRSTTVSAFYYRLICMLFDSKIEPCGSNAFSFYELNYLKETFQNKNYVNKELIECFTSYYNAFHREFFRSTDKHKKYVAVVKSDFNDLNFKIDAVFSIDKLEDKSIERKLLSLRKNSTEYIKSFEKQAKITKKFFSKLFAIVLGVLACVGVVLWKCGVFTPNPKKAAT